MNWADFEIRHDNCSEAFEVFGRHLFSKWCSYHYREDIETITYIGGKGGDGGVEAFALFSNGDLIGFQSKWFRDGFKDSQKKQIQKSIDSAFIRHPKLKTYIVCMPLELQGSKGSGNKGLSQHERWSNLQANNPGISLEFWGDTRIEEISIQIEAELFLSYWFNQPFLSNQKLNELFLSTKNSTYSNLYIPDMHIEMECDSIIQNSLFTSKFRANLVNEIYKLIQSVDLSIFEINRLKTLFIWESFSDEEKQIFSQNLLDLLSREELDLLKKIEFNSTELVISNAKKINDWIENLNSGLKTAIDILEKSPQNKFYLNPSRRCIQLLNKLLKCLDQISIQIILTKKHGKSVALIGEAGSGKTHSLLNLVESRINWGFGALVIPAKHILNPLDNSFLPNFIHNPRWSLHECFHAMESFAYSAWEGEGDKKAISYFLLAIDGVDESPNNALFIKMLSTWLSILKKYPRVKLVCTVRPHRLASLIPPESTLSHFHLNQCNPTDIDRLFKHYCQRYNIDISGQDWLKWALHSSRDIRLFAEIYKNQTLNPLEPIITSSSNLIAEKVKNLEQRIKKHYLYGWNYECSILIKVLLKFAENICKQNEIEINHERFIKLFKDCCIETKDLTLSQVEFIIDSLVSSGILIKYKYMPEDPLQEEIVSYTPSNQTIVDVLIAYYLSRQYIEEIPFILYERYEALSIFIQTINEKFNIYIEDMIYDEKHSILVFEAQCSSISRSMASPSDQLKQWLNSQFVRNKIYNRIIMNKILIYAARNTNHWCNSEYIHSILSSFSVADRDLFWSCPDDLPISSLRNKWEGYSSYEIDINLKNEDEPLGMPLILAWTCSSVDLARVQRCKLQLSIWGFNNPTKFIELFKLITKDCNDYQVIESMFSSALAASMQTREIDTLRKLAFFCYELLFSPKPALNTRNSVCRYFARAIIERAHLYRIIDESIVLKSRPPYAHKDDFLDFLNPNAKSGFLKQPLFHHDIGYILDKSSDGFFSTGYGVDYDPYSHYSDGIDISIAKAILSGTIPLEIEESSLNVIRNRVTEYESRQIQKSSAGFESIETLLSNIDLSKLEDEIIDQICSDHEKEERSFSPELNELLDFYSKEPKINKDIGPIDLRNGLILNYVYSLGWNYKTFYGDPKGGAIGEILGADISIMRTYGMATHGSRSIICSFGEKYVWIGVNEVAGDFSDRLPIKVCGNSRRIRCSSEVGSYPGDPFDGLSDLSLIQEENKDFEYEEDFNLSEIFGEKISLDNGLNQFDLSKRWLSESNWPNFEILIQKSDHSRVYLESFNIEPNSMIRQAIRMTALVIKKSHIDIFIRDLKVCPNEIIYKIFPVDLSEIEGATYQPPSVLAWSKWAKNSNETDISYVSIDNNGKEILIELDYLSSSSYWTFLGEETKYLLLSPKFSEKLDIASGYGNSNFRAYKNLDGNLVAVFRDIRSDSYDSLLELKIKTSSLNIILKESEYEILWVSSVDREISPELIDSNHTEDTRKGMFFVHTRKSDLEIDLIFQSKRDY